MQSSPRFTLYQRDESVPIPGVLVMANFFPAKPIGYDSVSDANMHRHSA